MQSRTIPVSGDLGVPPGTLLAIDAGSENEELAHLIRASRKRRTITVGWWRWYHEALQATLRGLRRVRGQGRRGVYAVQAAACRLLEHPLAWEDVRGDGERSRRCWCGERGGG